MQFLNKFVYHHLKSQFYAKLLATQGYGLYYLVLFRSNVGATIPWGVYTLSDIKLFDLPITGIFSLSPWGDNCNISIHPGWVPEEQEEPTPMLLQLQHTLDGMVLHQSRV